MFSLGKEQNAPVIPPKSNPEPNNSSRVKPKRVILNCHGLASEAFFNKGTNELDPLNIKIIACSDTDKNLSNFLKEHTNAKSYGDMRDFVNAVMEDPKLKEELRYPDILFTTAPCQGRSVLREENGIDPKSRVHRRRSVLPTMGPHSAIGAQESHLRNDTSQQGLPC